MTEHIANILITGANGQLGQAIRRLAGQYPAFGFYFTDVEVLDICNPEAVEACMVENRIAYIVNCAAYTAVDLAEKEEDKAFGINCLAVRNLGDAARKHGAKVIHLSTDYVFDGTSCRPYREEDKANPLSAYGRTKLAGEQALRNACPGSVIIRTAWLYSQSGHNFVNTMLRLSKERKEIAVVCDQAGTPTYAGDLASAILTILDASEKGAFYPGIYHFSNEGVCSWYDFALKIMELAKADCRIKAIGTSAYPTPAIRPPFSVLSKEKIKQTYKIKISHWEESLKRAFPEFAG